jgi:hypothetical protein
MEITVKNISTRIRDVLLHPKIFWKSQKNSGLNQTALFFGYLLPLVFIVSLGDFFG